MKFDITATVEMEVKATVEADSLAEAEDMVDTAIWDCDTEDGDITVSESNTQRTSVDSSTNLNQDAWDDLDKSEKLKILEDGGVNPVEACEWLANEDAHEGYLYDYIQGLDV